MLGKKTFRGRVLDVVADGFHENCGIIVRKGLFISKADLAVMPLVDAVGTQDMQVRIEVRG
jgi:hypothetical protein